MHENDLDGGLIGIGSGLPHTVRVACTTEGCNFTLRIPDLHHSGCIKELACPGCLQVETFNVWATRDELYGEPQLRLADMEF